MNQFHDILTGTSIGQVFEDAKKDYDRIDEIAGSVLQAPGRADARGGGVAGA
jgi:alpha-mannosidase